jgi:hypothetical protein
MQEPEKERNIESLRDEESPARFPCEGVGACRNYITGVAAKKKEHDLEDIEKGHRSSGFDLYIPPSPADNS